MAIAYAAIETLDPSWGQTWVSYLECMWLDHLQEVISLDGMLCPSIIKELTEEDWSHVADEHHFFGLFRDLGYLLDRIKAASQYQVIAMIREPTQSDVVHYADWRFEFKGYDLVDDATQISALTIC